MSRRILTLIVLVGALSSACADSPDAPTPVKATAQSIAVSGLPAGFSVGDTAQLAARLSWSDGRTEDVTGRARWTSSTLSCLVSASGLATAIEPGTCSITAAVAPVSAIATAAVGPASVFAVSGVVREQYAFREPPLPDGKVTIVSGPQTGRVVSVDAAGRFSMTGVPVPGVTFRVESPGFVTRTVAVTVDTGALDVFLAPETATITWTYRTTDPQRTPFEVRHRGPFALTVFSEGYECGTYEHFGASILRIDTRTVVAGGTPCTANVPDTLTGYLDPGNYELIIGLTAPSNARKTAELTYPR
jgi:hypothetical protein